MADSNSNFNLDTLKRDLPDPMQWRCPTVLLDQTASPQNLLILDIKSPLQSFHLFPTLPKELRLQIWECFIPPVSRKFRLRRRRLENGVRTRVYPPLHALFYTTSESRSVIQNLYLVIPQTTGMPAFVYPMKDTIVLTVVGLTKDNRFEWLQNLSLARNTSTLFNRIRKVVFFETVGHTKTFLSVESKEDPTVQQILKQFPALEVVGVVFGGESQMLGSGYYEHRWFPERQELCDRVELFFGLGKKDMGRKTRAPLIVAPLWT